MSLKEAIKSFMKKIRNWCHPVYLEKDNTSNSPNAHSKHTKIEPEKEGTNKSKTISCILIGFFFLGFLLFCGCSKSQLKIIHNYLEGTPVVEMYISKT